MKRRVRLSGLLLIGIAILGMMMMAAAGPPRMLPASPQSSSGITSDLIIERLQERNRLRASRLQRYSVPSTYRVTNDQGQIRAEVQVVLSYRAPGAKEFKIVSEKGSEMIRNRIFKPLMEVEVETAAGRNRHDSSITHNNYTFQLVGEEEVDGHRCFVLQTRSKRADKYLFNGKVWIHTAEFSVVRIAGQMAKSPSFWIKRVEFVRSYQRIGEFWWPSKNESMTQVKIFGKNVLTIDYGRYEVF